MSSGIEIYKIHEGEVVFNISGETLWATEEQISQLFGVDRSVINRHLNNIYREGELDERATCAKNAQVRMEGKRQVRREVKSYNLDAIISVGYRVNSRKATDFRIWATKVLKSYVVNGAAINEQRLKELDTEKLHAIEGMLGIVRRLTAVSELSELEAKGILEVISKYSPSFKALEEYDEGRIVFGDGKKAIKFLDEAECLRIVSQLRTNLHADEKFGNVKNDEFVKVLNEVCAEDGDASVAKKAGELLYAVIKKRPFEDGNKRIGALLFIVFLTMNDCHLTENGETKISDRALTALALLIAESDPSEKDLIIALICKLLED